MKPRVIFIHGNQSTHWSFAWTPWLKQKLGEAGYSTFFETMPDSVIARAKYWLPFLEEHVRVSADDVIVGWSSGAVAALRYAEGHKIRGSVLISPSVTDLGDDLEKQSGYYDTPWNWEAIKNNQEHIALVYGDDDPFIPQDQFETVQKELTPEAIKIPGGKHFIEKAEFPEVLDYIVRTFQ